MFTNAHKAYELNQEYRTRIQRKSDKQQLIDSLIPIATDTVDTISRFHVPARVIAIASAIMMILVIAGPASAQTVNYDAGSDGNADAGKFMIAILYMRGGAYEDAIVALDHVIEAYPEHAAAYTARAESYLNLGDYIEAIEGAEQALSLEPDYASAHRVLGQSYFVQGDFLMAESHLQDYVDLAEGDVDENILEMLELCAEASLTVQDS